MNDVAAFWDRMYATTSYSRSIDRPVLDRALRHFGDIRGRSILELGCGPGSSSLFFSALGANVTSVDISSKAIDDLNRLCEREGIRNLRGICASATQLGEIEPVDFVYGQMILHHIEPFGRFADQLRHIVKPEGKAFFYENNAASRLLVWFRNHIVGKFWVPKHGDADEFPLTPQEVDILRERFSVDIEYPEMLFFRLASHYLLRDGLSSAFARLDRLFYERQWLLRYSYRQYLLLSPRS